MTEPTPVSTTTRRRVLEIHIATTPEKLWNALLDPDATETYYYGSRFEGEAVAGAPYAYQGTDGPMIDGEIVEAVPHERLVMTFRPLFNLEPGGDPATLNVSRVTFAELEPDWIAAYCATGDPMDKAGAYGVQGRAGERIVRIDGSFYGVMGLPLYETSRLLEVLKCYSGDGSETVPGS